MAVEIVLMLLPATLPLNDAKPEIFGGSGVVVESLLQTFADLRTPQHLTKE